MFAKKYRFHRRNDVKRVIFKGLSARVQFMNLKTMPAKHDSIRVAVVVSKKVSKAAPLRNRLRRRVYEIVRIRHDAIKPGSDIVITIFDKRVEELSPSELAQSIDQLLKKSKLTS